ncbi:hypothetical protein NKJ55_31395 [Mesorhizobium sp. M0106]|uniref:hypothetical protein n=1 Tax=Mesorhizobium sp. M0106 TaxID=2956880 RepID=UPI00333DF54A
MADAQSILVFLLMTYGGEGGFELRAWKSVLLVFTVQAGYSGRQSALPRFVSDISAGN